MSTSSAKQKYTQIRSWLDTFKKSSDNAKAPNKRESRSDYYKKKGY